eukprot:s533_g15.t1
MGHFCQGQFCGIPKECSAGNRRSACGGFLESEATEPRAPRDFPSGQRHHCIWNFFVSKLSDGPCRGSVKCCERCLV